MKKQILINRDISYEIANLGHTDTICVSDAGLPVPKDVKKIDLAIKLGLPKFFETLKVILKEAHFEKAYLSQDIKNYYPKFINDLKKILNKECKIVLISHDQFKDNIKNCKSVIRTGENKWFHNVILQSGVTF